MGGLEGMAVFVGYIVSSLALLMVIYYAMQD